MATRHRQLLIFGFVNQMNSIDNVIPGGVIRLIILYYPLFQNPVNRIVDSLYKHLDTLQSEDEDKKSKAISKLSGDIAQIHSILYGDGEDHNPDHIQKLREKLVLKLLQTDTDLFCRLARHIRCRSLSLKRRSKPQGS
eukprot:1051133_1